MKYLKTYKLFENKVDIQSVINTVKDILVEISDDDVYALSFKSKNSDEFSSLIVSTAIDKGSRDNISCIVIKINWQHILNIN